MRSDKRNLLQDYFYKNYEDPFEELEKEKKIGHRFFVFVKKKSKLMLISL